MAGKESEWLNDIRFSKAQLLKIVEYILLLQAALVGIRALIIPDLAIDIVTGFISFLIAVAGWIFIDNNIDDIKYYRQRIEENPKEEDGIERRKRRLSNEKILYFTYNALVGLSFHLVVAYLVFRIK